MDGTVMVHTALFLVLIAMPLGTSPMEIATGFALFVAIVSGNRSERALLGPVMLIGACFAATSLGRGDGAMLEAAGRTWPLALAIAVPMLGPPRRWMTELGLWIASAVGLWSMGQWLVQGTAGLGFFSHHLTLGYALLPPLAWAMMRRNWVQSLCLILGISATGATGPMISMVAMMVALHRPLLSLIAGAGLSLVIIGFLHNDPELMSRSVLWRSGSILALDHPLGVSPAQYRDAIGLAQHNILHGFHFPHHAHDTSLQMAALGGVGMWIAWGWFMLVMWQQTHRAGRAAIVGVVIGGITQDTLGDLEVIRSLCLWALLTSPEPTESTVVISTNSSNKEATQ